MGSTLGKRYGEDVSWVCPLVTRQRTRGGASIVICTRKHREIPERGASRSSKIHSLIVRESLVLNPNVRTPMTDALPPAGWYSDPGGQPIQRWWDGTAWTNNTQQSTETASAPALVEPVSSSVHIPTGALPQAALPAAAQPQPFPAAQTGPVSPCPAFIAHRFHSGSPAHPYPTVGTHQPSPFDFGVTPSAPSEERTSRRSSRAEPTRPEKPTAPAVSSPVRCRSRTARRANRSAGQTHRISAVSHLAVMHAQAAGTCWTG